MNIFQTLIMSIVEGITEFLPISSTGHLILTAKLLNIPQTEFTKSFEIFIQLGAILSIIFLYHKLLLKNLKIWTIILAAFIPTGLLGLILYKYIKTYLLGNSIITLIALFIGGLFLIVIEIINKNRSFNINDISKITTKNAFMIGLAQSISMIPGVSRSAASIIGAQLLGINRETAIEFSFLLAVPTMAAATGLDLIKSSFRYDLDQYLILSLGFICSFLVAIIAVKFFVDFTKKHTFIPFGVYRIILALLFLILIYKK